jgi:thiol:disulfide interchange protein DsbC
MHLEDTAMPQAHSLTHWRHVRRLALVLATGAALVSGLAWAQDADLKKVDAEIRKTLAERYPGLNIDEIRAMPMANLYEVRMGNEVVYTDAKAQYIIQGEVAETASHRNLTQERINKLTQIDFNALPLKDAIVWKNGNGKRRIAVFADPNCGYCKKFEKDLLNVKDVTVYTFVIPILGGDSPEKSRSIWCAKDNTAVWRDWMVKGSTPPRAMGECDSAAIERNKALAIKHKINGTPAIVFEDGSRAPGAIPAAEVERRMTAKAPA